MSVPEPTLTDSLITAAIFSALFLAGLGLSRGIPALQQRRREREAVRQWRERVENMRLRRGERE